MADEPSNINMKVNVPGREEFTIPATMVGNDTGTLEVQPPDADAIKEWPLWKLALYIATDWSNRKPAISDAADAYLQPMCQLESIEDPYGADSGDMIVRYFLGNATTWRGPVARTIKAELTRRCPS
jgi:hypothetical protein